MHKQFNPFALSSSPYGAKMGRYQGNPVNLQDIKPLGRLRGFRGIDFNTNLLMDLNYEQSI